MKDSTSFIVSFARAMDIDTLVVAPVKYECSWLDTEAHAEEIIDAALTVALDRGLDMDKHEAFMISHSEGDFRFATLDDEEDDEEG